MKSNYKNVYLTLVISLLCLFWYIGYLVGNSSNWTATTIHIDGSESNVSVERVTSRPFVPNASEHRTLKELSIQLGSLVQKRLQFLQTPDDCDKARKLVCEVDACGFGCTISMITTCLMVGYATGRTVLLQKSYIQPQLIEFLSSCNGTNGANSTTFGNGSSAYQVVRLNPFWNKYKPAIYPPAVPADLVKKIKCFHTNPSLWWTSQIAKYIFRPTRIVKKFLQDEERRQRFSNPIVGVHVRRTDKKPEAKYQPVDKYMVQVEKWFKENVKTGVERRVYLATDEPTVIKEMITRYPNYTFLYSDFFVSKASTTQRVTYNGTLGIVKDVYFLTKCDFVVCTFSSNIGRLVYRLLQTEEVNVTNKIISLDQNYSLWGQRKTTSLYEPVQMPTYDEVKPTV